MPQPSDAERLAHMVQAITWLIEFIGGDMDYAGYLQDRKTQLSVERILEIIGEAASHISPELKARYVTLPWRQIIALRNVVSHEYFQLRLEVI
ncbi:MAG: DUF86 domain-containing protein [Chloroflexi bacterium]|nr:DUF86 domain-containing protein [Chloroflexota bacterium]